MHRRLVMLLCGLPTALLTNPLELVLAAVFAVNGGFYIAGQAVPLSVEDLLPDWVVTAWGAALLASGLLIIVSRARTRLCGDDLLRALAGMLHPYWRMERTGLLLFAITAPVYSIVALDYLHARAALSATFALGFGMACLLRGAAITLAVELVVARDGAL